jgi:CRP/FNR family transcriptional regulator, cyclic AMP receptor protein
MDPSRLSAISFFAGLDPSELDAIAATVSELETPEGDGVATQGEFGHAVYAIESGTVDVVVDGEVVRSLGPGDVFGEIAVLSSGRRTATVVATSPLKLLMLFKRDIWALERSAPEAAARLRRALEQHRSPV